MAIQFIQELILRFGIPRRIITNLGSTFTSSKFWDYYEDHGIKVYYASIAHPRANGQVKRANRLLLNVVKEWMERSLKKAEARWMNEIFFVVWGLCSPPS